MIDVDGLGVGHLFGRFEMYEIVRGGGGEIRDVVMKRFFYSGMNRMFKRR